MSLNKSHIMVRPIWLLAINRNLCFTFMLLVFLSGLLTLKSVSARTSIPEAPFINEMGYEKTQQYPTYLLAIKAFDNEEYVLSYRLMKDLAERGNEHAQYVLATLYDLGLGIEKDEFMAYRWYKKAAMADLLSAQHNLAVIYANGLGVKTDMVKAISWWKRAANKGHTDSQFNLGIIYATGRGIIKPDLDKAVKWWYMAAMKGDAAAQFNLGALYVNSYGTSGRTCEAVRLLRQSQKNGFIQANIALNQIEDKIDFSKCK